MTSSTQTQQQLPKRKFQACRNQCGVDIFFENSQLGRTPQGRWIPLQLDSLGQPAKHDCPNKKKKQQQDQQRPVQQQNDDLSKEVAAIKAQLQVLVMKLDSLEKELKK
jgi:hypothetical protein